MKGKNNSSLEQCSPKFYTHTNLFLVLFQMTYRRKTYLFFSLYPNNQLFKKHKMVKTSIPNHIELVA